MKKRNIFITIIVALCFIGVLGGIRALTSSKHSSKEVELTSANLPLPVDYNYKGSGSYLKSRIPDNHIIYSIEDSSCIIYNWNDAYLMAEPTETNIGVCYWNIRIDNVFSKFDHPELLGVSNKQLLFLVNDKNDESMKIAVEIDSTDSKLFNQSFHKTLALDKLTDEEKANFHAVQIIEPEN